MDEKLPVLFLWDESYGAYIPDSYRQIFFNKGHLKNKTSYTDFPRTILWVGRTWTEYKDSYFRTIQYIRDKELQQGSKIIGTQVLVEDIMEVADVEKTYSFIEPNLFKLSINTRKRVSISDIALSPDGFYYGRHEPYDDLPLTEQEKGTLISIIEEIKEKYVVLKDLEADKVGELVFPVQLKFQTIEEYASIFSLRAINIYRDHNMNYVHELFVTQNVVLRLQSILLKLDLLIEAMKKGK